MDIKIEKFLLSIKFHYHSTKKKLDCRIEDYLAITAITNGSIISKMSYFRSAPTKGTSCDDGNVLSSTLFNMKALATHGNESSKPS